MAVSIVMPALEMAQETGKLLTWRKQEGDTVVKGEPLIEIETDKVIFDVEAPEDGILAGVRQVAGAVVPVGEVIAWIVAPGEAVPTDTETNPSARTMTDSRPKTSAPGAAAAAPAEGGRVSPRARRMAQELGVDLATVKGTGPGAQITSDDIVAASKAKSAESIETTATPVPEGPALSTVARVMAERTAQAWSTVPHFFLSCDVDASALQAIRESAQSGNGAGTPSRVTVTDLLVALTGRVLKSHPKMNASWVSGTIRQNPEINISLAIAVKDGVVGAVIRECDTSNVAAIGARRRDVVDRARANQLRLADVEGGTFTISNLGMYGIDSFHAIVTPPQAAILAVGRVADRAVVVDGKIVIRPMMTLTLSSDHRVVDGAQAAAFLKDLSDAVASPQALLS